MSTILVKFQRSVCWLDFFIWFLFVVKTNHFRIKLIYSRTNLSNILVVVAETPEIQRFGWITPPFFVLTLFLQKNLNLYQTIPCPLKHQDTITHVQKTNVLQFSSTVCIRQNIVNMEVVYNGLFIEGTMVALPRWFNWFLHHYGLIYVTINSMLCQTAMKTD